MEAINLKDVIKAVGGELLNTNEKDLDNLYITDVTTDSRKVKKGSLFVPIAGEHFDGHNFIISSMEKGAVCVLTEKKETDIIGKYMAIYVKDTTKALGDLAKFYRLLFNIEIIGVTGSVGKTTTKDMLASVLEQKWNVLKTEGNYNNEIGMPLTVFKLKQETQISVLEMGMSEFGEIKYLSSIAKPYVAIITNIGTSHIENLGSREGILKAKAEIFDYLNKDGLVVLNADDDMLIELKDKLDFKICWFGIENKCGIYADNINDLGLDGTDCDIYIDTDVLKVHIPSPGKHMIYSVMASIAVARFFGLSFSKIKKGIEAFVPTQMRMNIIKSNNFTIINDAYNASPQSMKSALDVLKSSGDNRKVAILGDMFEMGDYAFDMHKEVGEYAAKIGIDIIICVGQLAKYIYESAYNHKKSGQTILYFENQEKLQDKVLEILNKYDIILVKASRGMYLEKTIDKIEKVEL